MPVKLLAMLMASRIVSTVVRSGRNFMLLPLYRRSSDGETWRRHETSRPHPMYDTVPSQRTPFHPQTRFRVFGPANVDGRQRAADTRILRESQGVFGI